MSAYDDVLLAVINLAGEANPYADIVIGALPSDSGISIAWAAGAPKRTFWDRNTAVNMTAVLNGKHPDQFAVSDTLGRIHSVLTRRKSYPEAASWQILDIATSGAPCYLGREQNKQWLYGSSLRVKFYLRGG